jgi:hypothetical protein
MRKSRPVQKAPFPLPDVVTRLVPVPTDGWDAVTPLALMDPKRAPILDNWIPRTGWVELRPGYQPYIQRLNGVNPVETLAVLRGRSQQFMVAACNGGLFNVSTSVPVLLGTFTATRWQYVNFTPSTTDTAVIQLVNGTDPMQQWAGDGQPLTVPSITGLPSGITTNSFINIWAQKRRLWYIPVNDTRIIYMPIDAVTGPIAGVLDLGSLMTRGGFVVAMSDWTTDGGTGPQDYAVFITSRGQVIVYAGDDPTNAAAFSLVGVFNLSPPLGYRCAMQSGSDVNLITLAGVIPLSQALPFDPSADRSVALTQRIQNAMQTSAQLAQNNFGWEMITFPAEAIAILNVPLLTNQSQVQYVMNALSGAWCRFTGWNANTFAIFNDLLYWGDNAGNINLGFDGATDFTRPIAADMQCAFNYFEDPGRTKRMTMIQPLMVVGGTVTPTLSVDVDFGASANQAPLTFISGGTLWDSAIWDQSVWPPLTQTQTDWYSTQALGHALAVRMQVNLGVLGGVGGEGLFDVALFDQAIFDGVPVGMVTLQVNAFNTILEMGAFV